MKSILCTLSIPICFALAIFCNVEIQGQTYDANTEQLSKTVMSRNMYFENNEKKQIHGTPFVNEEFKKGKVVLKEGGILRHDKINIELFLNEVQFKMSSMDTLFFYPLDMVSFVEIDEETYYADRRVKKGKGIIKIIYKGDNVSLGEHTTVSYRKSNYVQGLDMGRKYDEYLKDQKLLVIRGTKHYSIKKKSDLKAFGKNRREADLYMKEHKLKASNNEDLLRLVKYVDGLEW